MIVFIRLFFVCALQIYTFIRLYIYFMRIFNFVAFFQFASYVPGSHYFNAEASIYKTLNMISIVVMGACLA